jgi:membrane protease YdiL (CAAX protease family)
LITISDIPRNHPQQSAKAPAESSIRSDKSMRPGWPEIAVGLVVLAAVAVGAALLLGRLGLGPVANGLAFTALAGAAPLAGFTAAVMLRIRSLSAFGVRRTTWRWLLIGVGAGVVTFVLKSLAILAWLQLTGAEGTNNVQSVYGDGGSGGVLSLVLATMFIGLFTPLGEELLFRGVVTNALLRYGPFIGVVGSTLIFALAHGINEVFPAALVTGLIAGEVFRRSGSVWPGVVVHAVVNLPTVPALVLASAA